MASEETITDEERETTQEVPPMKFRLGGILIGPAFAMFMITAAVCTPFFIIPIGLRVVVQGPQILDLFFFGIHMTLFFSSAAAITGHWLDPSTDFIGGDRWGWIIEILLAIVGLIIWWLVASYLFGGGMLLQWINTVLIP
jgi:hypothetical protein